MSAGAIALLLIGYPSDCIHRVSEPAARLEAIAIRTR